MLSVDRSGLNLHVPVNGSSGSGILASSLLLLATLLSLAEFLPKTYWQPRLLTEISLGCREIVHGNDNFSICLADAPAFARQTQRILKDRAPH